ncbi:hypothetical protein K9L67_02560 [Candidatus Woesearchaeota archaeon]|nr:hypothetical protein [Candidatus Woesearchaeota archaeon]MCF7901087.1 hypothetical protein [Candidatus Woesearchaeota archaeon]MCF8013420.1 hypothetical protein [Candidatus Woesearchaeota archaeon]
MYPDLSEAIKNYEWKKLEGGCHDVFLIKISGKKLIYKAKSKIPNKTKKKTKEILKKIETPIIKYFNSKNPFENIRSLDQTKQTNIEEEIINEWKKRNIPTINIIDQKKDATIFQYIKSKNFETILNTNSYESKKYRKLLDLITIINKIAEKEQEINLLHPDNHLRNYLYSEETHTAIAIDPGLVLNKENEFNTVKNKLNLFMMYSILNLKTEHKETYLKEFIDTIKKEDLEQIKFLNIKSNIYAKTYFKTRTYIISAIRKKKVTNPFQIYSEEKRKSINNLIEINRIYKNNL